MVPRLLQKKAWEYGAFDYLTKPCDLEDLVGKIHQAVEYERGL